MAITKSSTGQSHAAQVHIRSSRRLSQRQSKAPKFKQVLFYIINTAVLIIIAFIAGYNLKGVHVDNSADSSISAAEAVMRQAQESRMKVNKLIETLKNYEVKHFETETTKTEKTLPERAETITTTPETISDTEIYKKKKPIETIRAVVITPEKVDPIVKVHGKSVETLSTIKKKPIQTADKPAKIYTRLPRKKAKKRIRKLRLPQAPPLSTMPGVTIHHTIKKGEFLSMFVESAHMADFLSANPHIKNPNLIYPGQTLMLKLPEQSIKTGVHMNNYFVQPAIGNNGKETYNIVRSINVPGNQTLMGHIISKAGSKIIKNTTPYINIASFSNTMKEEIFEDKVVILSDKNKLNMVKKSNSGIYFKTIRKHPVFKDNQYKGVHLQPGDNLYKNIDMVKDFIIRYLAGIKSSGRNHMFFHFMIFDRTVVQTDYLENSYFNNNGNKSKILIGLAFSTKQTSSALYHLQSSLTTCKVDPGEMSEVTVENIELFVNPESLGSKKTALKIDY